MVMLRKLRHQPPIKFLVQLQRKISASTCCSYTELMIRFANPQAHYVFSRRPAPHSAMRKKRGWMASCLTVRRTVLRMTRRITGKSRRCYSEYIARKTAEFRERETLKQEAEYGSGSRPNSKGATTSEGEANNAVEEKESCMRPSGRERSSHSTTFLGSGPDESGVRIERCLHKNDGGIRLKDAGEPNCGAVLDIDKDGVDAFEKEFPAGAKLKPLLLQMAGVRCGKSSNANAKKMD